MQRNAWEVAAGRAAERGRRTRDWRPGRAGAANGAEPPSLRRRDDLVTRLHAKVDFSGGKDSPSVR